MADTDRKRVAELVGSYTGLGLGLGTVGASASAVAVAVAEGVGVTTVAASDRHHLGGLRPRRLSGVRPRHVDAFELVP